MTTDDDRRHGLRAPIELKVEYKRLNTFFADYTRNISRGGTFIGTDKPLKVGTEFVFALGIPNIPEPLRLRGRQKPADQVELGAGPQQGRRYGAARAEGRCGHGDESPKC